MTAADLDARDEVFGPVRRLLVAVADRIGCTEGQVQSIAIGLVVALLTAAIGLPPVFEDRALTEFAVAPAPAPAPLDGASAPENEPVTSGAAPPISPAASTPDPRDPGAPGPAAPSAGTPDAPGTAASGRAGGRRQGVPGEDGRCELVSRSIDNPRHTDGAEPSPVWIFEPAGAAEASIVGGRCDSPRRPVVLFAHGFGQTDPAAYAGFIEHLVSVGNIVVYPTYEVNDGERSTLEESHRVVDAGFVAAVEATRRIDTLRVGVWGHSHGGGMVPYLVQQTSARGWGRDALWMSNVAQAFTQLVGAGDIPVPAHVQAMTVAFEHDALADARLGIDIYKSLVIPRSQKRHVTVLSDPSEAEPFIAEHGAPTGAEGQADAVDRLLWRYADLLELCALHGESCDADLTTVAGSDGAPTERATVSDDPVDVGPYPAVLAECDAGFGLTLNPRIDRCGDTRI